MAFRGSPRFLVLAVCLVLFGFLLYSGRNNEQLNEQLTRYTPSWTYGDGDALDLDVPYPGEHEDALLSPTHAYGANDDFGSHPLGEDRVVAAPGDLDPAFHPAYPPSAPPQQPPLPSFCDYCGPTDKLCKRYGPFNLARSRAYEGPNTRLKRVLAKARAGQKIKIGVLGGSVTKGHGVSFDQNWTTLYGKWWKETFGIEVEVTNGGVGATVSDYMDTCFHEHIPEDVDLVVIEMAINDQRLERLAEAYNNLIRGIFELPTQPAIINLQIMALSFSQITMGGDLHMAVAQYYDTPIVSVRNVLLPHVLQTTGEDKTDNSVNDYWFHHNGDNSIDLRHMNFNGHRLMADLLGSFTGRVACEGLKEEQAREEDDYEEWLPAPEDNLPTEDVTGEYVPRISMFQKYEPDTFLEPFKPFCMTTTATKHPLVALPELSHGFEKWSHPQNPGKVFLRATKPGAQAVFNVSTSALGRVRVTYLRSRDYGLGTVACWADDKRDQAVRLDGWWDVADRHMAQPGVVAKGLAPGAHLITCELLKDTKDPGKGTDFRITAVDGA